MVLSAKVVVERVGEKKFEENGERQKAERVVHWLFPRCQIPNTKGLFNYSP